MQTNYKLADLIDLNKLQLLLDKFNDINPFLTALLDNDGNILTATGWQDVCTKFHRLNPESEKECKKSDQYILSHLGDASPAVTYKCSHGLIDSASPIIINGVHYGNFFTGQFLFEEPDIEYFRQQAKKYGFDEKEYIDAIKQVPVKTKEELARYQNFITTLIDVIVTTGMDKLRLFELNSKITQSEEKQRLLFDHANEGIFTCDLNKVFIDANNACCVLLGRDISELKGKNVLGFFKDNKNTDKDSECQLNNGETILKECLLERVNNENIYVEISIKKLPDNTFLGITRNITDRKNAEIKLKETLQNWNAVFDSIQDPIMILTNEHIVIDLNKTAMKMCGLKREEIINKKCFQIFHKTDVPIAECPCKLSIYDKQPHTNEYSVNNKVYELTSWPVLDENNEVFRLTHIVKDITKQKTNEELIKAKNEQLQAQNEEYSSLNEELVQTNAELVKSRQIIETSEIHYRSLFENMLNGFAYCRMIYKDDKPWDFEYISVNKSFEILTGLKDVTGKLVSEVIPGIRESDSNLFDIYGRVSKTGIPESFEIYLESMKMWYSISVYSPEKGYFVAIFDVITARKEAEEKLKWSKEELQSQNEEYETLNEELMQTNSDLLAAKEKAEESDKLKSAFLANLSHEIRTPMNAILGFVELLKNPDLAHEKKEQFISIVHNSGHQLLAIINDIIEISKIETRQIILNSNNTSLNFIIDHTYSVFEMKSSKKKNIRFSYFKGFDNFHCNVILDEIKLQQILSNLLDNAFKFTDSGSIEFGYNVNKNKEIEFFVRDTGVGIDNSLTSKIFDRFNQVEEAQKPHLRGLGLGLAISKGYVELMGGKIWLESIPGKGTTFFFTVPFKPIKPDVIDNTKSFDATNILLNKKILIAEDEEANFELISQLLSETGAEIIRATDGVKALEIFVSTENLDLLLIDLKMPNLDGFETIAEIRKYNTWIPIIANTAYSFEEEKRKAFDSGCNDFLTKPIHKETLIKIILKHITDLNN